MAKSTKVLVCTHLYPTENLRTSHGVTFAVRDLVEKSVGNGLDVVAVVRFVPLVSRKGFRLPMIRSVGGITVMDCPRVCIGRIASMAATRLLFRLMFRMLGSGAEPDRVVCHSIADYVFAIRIFNFEQATRVYVVHGSDFSLLEEMRKAATTADVVAARSQALANRFKSQVGRSVDGVAFSGVSEEFFDAAPKPQETLRLMTACALIELKHVADVICSMKVLLSRRPGVEVRLDIFGDGPLHSSLQEIVSREGLGELVTFHGHQPKEVVGSAMRDAHVFLMPSAPETFGLAYFEALAKGCIVVGHKGWGVDGVVSEGVDGYLVEQATPENIADKVLAYLESNRSLLHKNAYTTARKFTDTLAVRNYCSLVGGTPQRGLENAAHQLYGAYDDE